MSYTIFLENYGCLMVSGSQADVFLQNQITCDVRKISNHGASLAACCDLKGRMLVNFWICSVPDADTKRYLLILPKNTCAILLKRLQKYAMFSKVTIADATHEYVIAALLAVTSEEVPSKGLLLSLLSPQDFLWLIPRTLLAAERPQFETADYLLWEKYQFDHGLVILQPETSALFLPQMIGLPQLGGVSFDKGCYLGQEVIARTQYLGNLKRHLHRGQIASEAVIKIGDAVVDSQEQAMGVVVHFYQGGSCINFLCVLHNQALDKDLFIAAQPVKNLISI